MPLKNLKKSPPSADKAVMKHWYLGIDGKQVGPLAEAEVARWLASGRISKQTLAWCVGMKEWQPLGATEFPVAAAAEAEAPVGPLTVVPSQVEATGTGQGEGETRFAQAASVSSTYGGFWLRTLAFLLDSLAVGTAVVTLAFLAGLALAHTSLDKEYVNRVLAIVSPLASLAANFFYFAILQTALEGTPGKYACGLRLVRGNLKPISFAQGIGRYFLRVAVTLPFGLGLFAVGWHPRKQGWHDVLAGTLVVDKDFLEKARANAPAELPVALTADENDSERKLAA